MVEKLKIFFTVLKDKSKDISERLGRSLKKIRELIKKYTRSIIGFCKTNRSKIIIVACITLGSALLIVVLVYGKNIITSKLNNLKNAKPIEEPVNSIPLLQSNTEEHSTENVLWAENTPSTEIASDDKSMIADPNKNESDEAGRHDATENVPPTESTADDDTMIANPDENELDEAGRHDATENVPPTESTPDDDTMIANPDENESDEADRQESIKDIYALFIREKISSRPSQILNTIEFYDINDDGLSELVALWVNKDNTQIEEIYSIREGNPICIFSTAVNWYNLWIAENDKGKTLCKVLNKNNMTYIIHDYGYEYFGCPVSSTDYPEYEYLLSQRFTKNDRDYIMADWDSGNNLMYVTKKEYDDAEARIVGDKVYNDTHDSYHTGFNEEMSDERMSAEWEDIISKNGIQDEMVDIPVDTERNSGKYIGKVYITNLAPDGINLHYTPDLDEESRDNDLGPVGAGYRDNENGDVFYVEPNHAPCA